MGNEFSVSLRRTYKEGIVGRVGLRFGEPKRRNSSFANDLVSLPIEEFPLPAVASVEVAGILIEVHVESDVRQSSNEIIFAY